MRKLIYLLLPPFVMAAPAIAQPSADPEQDPRVIQLEQDKSQLDANISSQQVRDRAFGDAKKYDQGLSDADSPVEQRLRELRDQIETAVKQYESGSTP
jgi:hypothetical protein